jgi:hypothetical protein
VIVLFRGLAEKMVGELGQGFPGKIGRDRDILERGAKFIADLFVNRVDDFRAREHGNNLQLSFLR